MILSPFWGVFCADLVVASPVGISCKANSQVGLCRKMWICRCNSWLHNGLNRYYLFHCWTISFGLCWFISQLLADIPACFRLKVLCWMGQAKNRQKHRSHFQCPGVSQSTCYNLPTWWRLCACRRLVEPFDGHLATEGQRLFLGLRGSQSITSFCFQAEQTSNSPKIGKTNIQTTRNGQQKIQIS